MSKKLDELIQSFEDAGLLKRDGDYVKLTRFGKKFLRFLDDMAASQFEIIKRA